MDIIRNAQDLTDRLVQIAPQSDRIRNLEAISEEAWVLGFDDDGVVILEWARHPDRIVLSAMIGEPPAERAVEVFETALSYTALWQESGGARIAKGGADGELVLIRELHTGGHEEWELLRAVEHFSNVAAWWRHYACIEAGTPLAARAMPLDVLQVRA
jgi:hypothetical protein